jgi:hypothetical protein
MSQENEGAAHDATDGHGDNAMCNAIEDRVDVTVGEQTH